MAATMEDIKRVKAMGFLFNRESTDEFSARVITGNGTITAEHLAAVAEAAAKFGNGKIAITTRMTLELPGVHYDDIPAFQEFLKGRGLYTGGTGDRLRPVVSCKGTTCVFGQVDTQAVAQELHKRFYEGWSQVTLPHKFKVAVGGCPNNCVKPDLNDFGLVGCNVPEIQEDLCRGCKKCAVEAVCLMKAPKVVDGKITIDRSRCNACGKCIKACYFHSIKSGAQGMRAVVGGKWGRMRRIADELEGVYDTRGAGDLLEKVLLLYRKYGYQKERFGDMIERLGIGMVETLLAGDELLREKEAILAASIQTRP